MLVYRPSKGNAITEVGVSKDAEWFGESLGGVVVPRLKLPFPPKNPIESNLSSLSTWFFKDITDYDFINGSATYRAIYIGANDKFDENEILGTIATSVSDNSGDPDLANSVEMSMWREGDIYDLPSGLAYGSGIILDNEQDTTNKLASAVWTNSVAINQTLIPGQYVKIWLKIKSKKDLSLIESANFIYQFTVGSLVIPVARTRGRLNISKIYSVSLDNNKDVNDFILHQTLPYDFDTNKIVKVVDHLGTMNVFYFDEDNKLKIICVKPDIDINENKYVEVDLSPITGDISAAIANQLYTEVSQCVTIPPTGDPIPDPSTNDYLNKRFIIDIHTTKKDKNIFYIFFNEFVSDSDVEYQENYGHKLFIWKNGVIKVDLDNVNSFDFSTIEPGLANKKLISVTDQNLVFEIGEWHYITSVVLLDDLFVCAGFDVEDCRVIDNKAKLDYIWERDIITGKIKVQRTLIPKVDNNTLHTIKNRASKEAYLVFDNIALINRNELDYNRETIVLDNDKKYVNLGSQTRRRVFHDYSAVSYDVPLKIDDFSSTWAFSVDRSSITTQTTGTTSSQTTSAPSTGTPFNKFVLDNPYAVHLQLQSDFDFVIANPDDQAAYVKSWDFLNEYVSVFRLHCNGDPANYAVATKYSFFDKRWKVTTFDKDNNAIEIDVVPQHGQELSVDYENVITINVTRTQVFGCGKKYMVHFEIYVSGKLLYSGETFTTNTTDTYVISHNDGHNFSGGISYFEVREYLENSGADYAYAIFQVHTNLSWAELETEATNINSPNGFEFYGFKRNLLINNLSWSNEDNSVIFPIVLQGNAYNIDAKYNEEIRRSVFNFNKIDVNKPSFSFTYEGISVPLQWYAEQYDFDTDIMVVWVKLENWKGQRVTMYYGDIRLIQDDINTNGIFNNFYGVWLMDHFIEERYLRYTTNNIFDVGEGMLVEKDANGIFMIQLDKQYMFGIKNLYKSNQFDIKYNDYNVDRHRAPYVKDFIVSQAANFRPAFMEIRNVDSIHPYKIESNNSDKD
jgi:hypothetical protein